MTKPQDSQTLTIDTTSIQNNLSKAVKEKAWDRVLVAVIKGADPQDARPRGGGYSALHYAISDGRIDVTDALLSLGANPNHIGEQGRSQCFAPIHLAAMYNQPKTIELLLRAGANTETKDEFGKTPVIHAADVGNIEAIDILMKFGADPNAVQNDGKTSLHFAAKNGNVEAIRLLLKAGGNPIIADCAGETVQQIAKQMGNKTIQALLSQSQSSVTR